jgi:predicted nucleic acid-binding protein
MQCLEEAAAVHTSSRHLHYVRCAHSVSLPRLARSPISPGPRLRRSDPVDTSIFIAQEQGRGLAELPDEAAISVMTLAELHVGVLLAKSPKARAQRLRTLGLVERTFDPIPVDDRIARIFAEVVADVHRKGKHPRVVDALIAATAVVNDTPIYSQDTDFERMPGVRVVMV